MKVYSVGGITMVGYGGPFPRPRGNCFGVYTKRCRKYYQIVNFGYENLEELLRRKLIDWPIMIEVLRPYEEENSRAIRGIAIIKDDRIPEEWYSKEYCTVCCPQYLIPKEKDNAQNE